MNEKTKPFPKRLRFTRFIVWLGLLLGVFFSGIGLLGFVTGTALSILGGNPGEFGIWLKFAGYGLLETIVFFRIVTLLPQRTPNIPAKIVTWLWWFTILQLLLSVMRLLTLDDHSGVLLYFGEEWLMLVFFYFYISSEFRFEDEVFEYYGSCAPPSKFDGVNDYGRKFMEFIGRE